MVKQTRRLPIAAARNHVNFHAVTLQDKLSKIVVRCAAYFMTRRQNLQYKISSQQKLKTNYEYVPKCYQFKLELDVEKGTKEGEAFQSLSEKRSQVIAKCQLNSSPLSLRQGTST